MYLRKIIFLFFIFLLFACSKNETVYKPTEKIDPFVLYKEGLEAFETNDFFYASKKFSEAELNFSNPEFAAKSSIMASYSLYGINFYAEAEASHHSQTFIMQIFDAKYLSSITQL